MTTHTDTPCNRALENEIEINAPAQAVWEAISTSDGLASWFPLEAKVTPGEGGKVWFSWGEAFQGESTIEVWEPGKHMRTRWEAGDLAVADDFTIESRAGKTVLRLVTQGFGNQASWDGQYDCLRKGWMFELRGLKNYLERHPGQTRLVAWAQHTAPASLSSQEVWDRLMGPDALAIDTSLEAGARFTASDGSGGALAGEVLAVERGGTLVARVEGKTPGLLRVELNPMGEEGAVAVWVWLSTYGLDEQGVKGFEQAWQAKLPELLGA